MQALENCEVFSHVPRKCIFTDHALGIRESAQSKSYGLSLKRSINYTSILWKFLSLCHHSLLFFFRVISSERFHVFVPHLSLYVADKS